MRRIECPLGGVFQAVFRGPSAAWDAERKGGDMWEVFCGQMSQSWDSLNVFSIATLIALGRLTSRGSHGKAPQTLLNQ